MPDATTVVKVERSEWEQFVTEVKIVTASHKRDSLRRKAKRVRFDTVKK